jgi:hypothetical protein
MAANQVRRFSRLSIAVATAGLVIYMISFSRQASNPPVPTDGASAADAPPTPPPQAAATTQEASALSSAATLENGPLRVEFVPQGPCWLAVQVDGKRVFAQLLQAGDRQTFAITDEVVLRVGEPGAMSMSINGQPGRPLGRPGQPVTVRITKDNYRAFLSS